MIEKTTNPENISRLENVTHKTWDEMLKAGKAGQNNVTTEKGKATGEKMYIFEGKAYKQSALEKQGHDVSTLEEYKP